MDSECGKFVKSARDVNEKRVYIVNGKAEISAFSGACNPLSIYEYIFIYDKHIQFVLIMLNDLCYWLCFLK